MACVPDDSAGATEWKMDGPEFQPAANQGFTSDHGGGGATGFDGDDGYTGENVSKHATGEDGPRDNTCRICHAEGHFARECPEKDDPNREFTGNCRICDEVGHRAAQCPSRPPQTCKICRIEGHIATECPENRVLMGIEVNTADPETAWNNLLAADAAKGTDGIKMALLKYAKCVPDLTFPEIEQALRAMNANTYLMALEKDVGVAYTIVNLQGHSGLKYVLSIQFQNTPRRAKFAGAWPKTPEENMARLNEAGWPLPSMVIMCYRCGEVGHTTRNCKQTPAARTPVLCVICGGEGHRARECTEERRYNRKPQVCRNCDQEGHKASECSEPPKCRNCDEVGHTSKECPKPTDWSRVECRVCHEKGHSAKRCPQAPPVVEDGSNAASDHGGYNTTAEIGGNNDGDAWGAATEQKAPAAADGGWGTAPATQVATGGW